MGFYKYLKDAWKDKALQRQRMTQWREEPVTIRIERPTRLDRARALGYKPKQGIILVRQRIGRGGRMRPKATGGRRPKHARRRKVLDISYQTVCEIRSVEKYPNMEVLNSYFVGKDGKHYWYEIILVERSHPAIKKDEHLRWITKPEHKGRVFRGLTSSSIKSRGLRRKGFGAEKVR